MGSIGLVMRSFWSDPYLWVHLAGLAALPLFLLLCLIGFAVGDPFLPVWVELLLVAAVGIAPILWMQWQQPFYIFSLVAVALKPTQLTEDQRRLLTLFKSQRHRILAVCVPIALLFVLVKIYGASAIATSVVPFPVQWRGAGLLLAAVAFLGSNLFAQVPASVFNVMLTSESVFATTTPYPLDQIRSSFSLFGLQINQILPPVIPDVQPGPATVPSGTTEVALDPVIETAVESVEVAEPVTPPSQPEPIASAPDPNADNPNPEHPNPENTRIETAPSDSQPESPIPEATAPGEDAWEE